jgi:hypothetical protein
MYQINQNQHIPKTAQADWENLTTLAGQGHVE